MRVTPPFVEVHMPLPLVRHALASLFFVAVAAHASGGERGASSPVPVPSGGVQQLGFATCGNAARTSHHVDGTSGVILPVPQLPTLFTGTLSGALPYIWDLDFYAILGHQRCEDLDVTLTSPAGTTIVITTDNAGNRQACFQGTDWDDDAQGFSRCATQFAYANNVVATPLQPEGRLSAFRGENPNGTWTLSVFDDSVGSTGFLGNWNVIASSLPSAPPMTTTSFTRSPGLAISTAAAVTVTDSMVVSGMGSLLSTVKLYVELPHTFASDLELTLTTPGGLPLRVITDCGGGNDHVFNGTLFDPSSTLAPTDHVFANGVPVPVLAPEGSFDVARDTNPNGTWTLTVVDDASGDGGTLVSWRLDVTTYTPTVPPFPLGFLASGTAIPDRSAVTTTMNYTAVVSGAGPSLWDVDLTTFIRHTANGNLEMRLRSPAGTQVIVSDLKGGTFDDVFDGTRWDDDEPELVTEHAFADGVAPASLAPEGRLAAFRGENPNGTWTLSVTDLVPLTDYGTLDAWSLDLVTLDAAPVTTTTTFSSSPNIVLPFVGTSSNTDPISVSGLDPFVHDAKVYVELPHTRSRDLEVRLVAPSGKEVVVLRDNGFENADVFNGTLFDPDAISPVTRYPYTSGVVATPLAPKGGFDPLVGEDPNGDWTLIVRDRFGGEGGLFARWDLVLATCGVAGTPICTTSPLGPDHTSACPCGNTGAFGNGCAHSFSADGANLTATGASSSDTIVLASSNEPATSFTLFLQHSASGDAVFHDGVLCASGTLVRLRGRAAVGGAASFPNSTFAQDATTTLSARGGTFPGSGITRFYSAWFRNASTTFCPPATANVTNGWRIAW